MFHSVYWSGTHKQANHLQLTTSRRPARRPPARPPPQPARAFANTFCLHRNHRQACKRRHAHTQDSHNDKLQPIIPTTPKHAQSCNHCICNYRFICIPLCCEGGLESLSVEEECAVVRLASFGWIHAHNHNLTTHQPTGWRRRPPCLWRRPLVLVIESLCLIVVDVCRTLNDC